MPIFLLKENLMLNPEKSFPLPLPPSFSNAEEGDKAVEKSDEDKSNSAALPPLPSSVDGISVEVPMPLPQLPPLGTVSPATPSGQEAIINDTPNVLIHPETGDIFDAQTGDLIHKANINTDDDEPQNSYEETEEYSEEPKDLEGYLNGSKQSHEQNHEIISKNNQSRWAAGGRPSEMKAKIPEIIAVREWDSNTEDDPIYGLGAEKDEIEYKPKTNKKIVLNERDFIMMNFMTKHRYCYSDQLSRLVGAENKDVRARLFRLEKEGYIRRETITRGQDLWLTKKAGLQIIGSPYSAIGKGQISPAAIQHTIGVGNLAVELEMGAGAENILGEKDFPKMNRYLYGQYDPDSEPTLFGEMTVSEREIRSSNRVLRGSNNVTPTDLKYKVQTAAADLSAPERLDGNEWMFAVYSKGEHFPDLVVSRPRAEDGSPQHIAIELELTAKDLPSWRRILKWYKQDGIMFSKVYYFTHVRTIATRVQKVVDELDLTDRVILRKYIPRNNRGPFWG
jgi:hypothetical protein